MNATDFLHQSSATEFLRGGAKKETPFVYKALDFLTGHFPEAGETEELVNGAPNPKFTGDASISFLNQPGLAVAAGGVGGFKAAGSVVKKLATGAAEAAGWATGGLSDVPKLAKGGVEGVIKAVEAKPLAELRATREASGITHATVPITAETGKPVIESLANTAPKTAKDFLNEDTVKVEPKVYVRKSDIETYSDWGTTQYQHKTSRELMKGEPVTAEQLPSELYHVTTNADAVYKSGLLKNIQEGEAGLGKGTSMAHQGVSLTLDKNTAELIQRDLINMGEVARTKDVVATIKKIGQEDARISGQSTDNAVNEAIRNYNINKDAKGAYDTYLWGRETATGMENPIFFGSLENYKKITPENTKIITISPKNIPSDAYIRKNPINKHLNEVMVHSDIPVQQSRGTKTGTRKEIVEKEIAESGRPEIDRPINQSFTPDDIKTKVDLGEIKPRELAEELSKKSRAVSGDEINALGYDRAILKNEHANLEKLIDDARIKGDADAEIKLLDEQSKIYEFQKKNDLALSNAQEEWGRAGHSLQKEIAEDYSFSNMQRQAEKTLGRELNAAEKQKYKNLSKQIEEADLKIKQYEDQIAAFKTQKAVGRIRNEVALERRKIGRVATKIELDTEFDSLVKELNATLSSLHANPFADPKATILLGKMAKNRVKSGVITMEGLVDEVYTAVKNLGYEVSKREVRDAISQYGVTAQLSKDEINVQLRELRRQMRLTSALEDAQKGITPLRSGLVRDAKTEQVLKLEKEVKQAMRENGIDVTKVRSDEEQWKTALQTYKTRTTNRIKELEQKMQTGDFAPKKRRELVMDKEAIDLKFKKDQVIKAYQKAKLEDTLARRSFLTKAKDTGMEVLNVARAIKTSMDLSAVLRQGAFIALGHPVRGLKAMPSMFKALRSEKGQFAVEQEIMQRANYPLYEQAKLYLSEHGSKLSTMEEAYMSHWADKIPGVAASGRAYTTYLNRLRADSFDAMLKDLPTVAGKASPEETKAIANFINVATGRGNLGAKENALVGLNTVFFAPRYVASRFQLVMGQPFKGGTWTTKKMVAKEYARFLMGLGVVYAIGKAAGAEIEYDPRSSDFGKLRFGNTRIDPMAGLSQTTVFITRALTGQTKPVGQKAHKMDSRAYIDVYTRFARSKIAPVPGTALNWKAGQDVVGNKIKPIGTAQDFLLGKSIPSNLVMPLAISDIYDTMREQGIPSGSAMALLSIFGMGLQTYNRR